MSHVELTDGAPLLAPVGNSVDDETTRSTDPFAAIVLEGNGLFALGDEVLVEDIEHLEERHVGVDVFQLIGLETALVPGVLLPPDVKRQPHL